jgi:hypothetical protein
MEMHAALLQTLMDSKSSGKLLFIRKICSFLNDPDAIRHVLGFRIHFSRAIYRPCLLSFDNICRKHVQNTSS